MSTTNDVTKVTPVKEQLLSFKRNVLCTEEGCSKSFVHEGALRMHLVKSHGHIKTESDKRLFHNRKRSEGDMTFQFHCPEPACIYNEQSHKHFSTYSLVKQHFIKVHAERRFKCEKCDQAFQLERDLRRHGARCGVLYQCATCPVKYTTTEALLTHCKRHDHVYPEEYRRQKAEMKPNKSKPSTPKETVVHITTHPVILVSVNIPEQTKAAPVQPIRPKTVPPLAQLTPVTAATPATVSAYVKVSSAGTEDNQDSSCHGDVEGDIEGSGAQVENGDNMSESHRHNAMIQTDIYGVTHLAVNNKNCFNGSNAVDEGHGQTVREVNKHESTIEVIDKAMDVSSLAKSGNTCKRKLNGPSRKENILIPRKKQMKSTTGIQTSVSLTGKKRMRTVCGTQTTGDYILQTAMARANIPVERRTIGSQVTPQKSRSDRKSKCSTETQTSVQKLTERNRRVRDGASPPVLVDFFSQVRERHIWAETCHNLAEQQTMTDLPLSTATQTLQSYLENLQERHNGNIIPGLTNAVGTEFVPALRPVEQNVVMVTSEDVSIATVIGQRGHEDQVLMNQIKSISGEVSQEGTSQLHIEGGVIVEKNVFGAGVSVVEGNNLGGNERQAAANVGTGNHEDERTDLERKQMQIQIKNDDRSTANVTCLQGQKYRANIEGKKDKDRHAYTNRDAHTYMDRDKQTAHGKDVNKDTPLPSNKDNVVKIFGENLDSSVEFVLPTLETRSSMKQKEDDQLHSCKNHLGVQTSSGLMTSSPFSNSHTLQSQSGLTQNQSRSTKYQSRSTQNQSVTTQNQSMSTQIQSLSIQNQPRRSSQIQPTVSLQSQPMSDNVSYISQTTISTLGTSNYERSFPSEFLDNASSNSLLKKSNDREIMSKFDANSAPVQSKDNSSVSTNPSNTVVSSGFESPCVSMAITPWPSDSSTIDTEAQTMTAMEFNRLLESSGIFLDAEQITNESNSITESSAGYRTQAGAAPDLGPEFDFLNSVPTIDMNTQTATDFSLFEGFVSMDTNTQTGSDVCNSVPTIDMNTQTATDVSILESYVSMDTNTQTGRDVDLLDLVMTNMETQTLNEDDMISLGLLESPPFTVEKVDTTSLGVGTYDVDIGYVEGIDTANLQPDKTDMHSLGVGTYDDSLNVGLSGEHHVGVHSLGVGTYDDSLRAGLGGEGGDVRHSLGVGTYDDSLNVGLSEEGDVWTHSLGVGTSDDNLSVGLSGEGGVRRHSLGVGTYDDSLNVGLSGEGEVWSHSLGVGTSDDSLSVGLSGEGGVRRHSLGVGTYDDSLNVGLSGEGEAWTHSLGVGTSDDSLILSINGGGGDASHSLGVGTSDASLSVGLSGERKDGRNSLGMGTFDDSLSVGLSGQGGVGKHSLGVGTYDDNLHVGLSGEGDVGANV